MNLHTVNSKALSDLLRNDTGFYIGLDLTTNNSQGEML